MMPEKLLLFDFDGVLVDSLSVYARTIQSILEKIGQPIVKSEADYLVLFDDNFYESLQKRGVDLEAFAWALEDYKEQMGGDYYGDVKLFPFMPPILLALCRDHRLGIISSNSSDAIEKIFAGALFEGCFEAILGADFALSKKDKIAHALERFRAIPENVYYIGDTVGDVKEGRMAGVVTVAVTWGWHSREKLLAARPDILIESPEGLLSL